LEPRDATFFNQLKALRQHQYEDWRGEYFSKALYDRVAGVELGDQFVETLRPDKQPHSRFFALALAVGQVAGGLRVTVSNTRQSDAQLLLTVNKGRAKSGPLLDTIKTALQGECKQVRATKGTKINIGLLDSLYVIPSFRNNSGTHTAVHLMRACSTFCDSAESKVDILFIMTNKERIQADCVQLGATVVAEAAAQPVAGQVPATELWLLKVDLVVPFFAKCGLLRSGPV
jgi:hypothetical protein